MTDDSLCLVQAFLARKGTAVFLVSLDHVADMLVCDCPGFGVKGRCKHTRYVEDQLAENDGQFFVPVPEGTDLADLTVRELVLRYSVPVVLS